MHVGFGDRAHQTVRDAFEGLPQPRPQALDLAVLLAQPRVEAREALTLGRIRDAVSQHGEEVFLLVSMVVRRSNVEVAQHGLRGGARFGVHPFCRKSTRLNSSHSQISYA